MVRNYKEILVGYKDYSEKSRKVIHYSYDLFIQPKLVRLIDRLLNNDTSVIEEINNYDYTSEITTDDIINAKKGDLDLTDDNNYTERIRILRDLQKLEYDKMLNQNQKSTEKFYHKLLSMIMQKDAVMYRKKDLKEFQYFFNIDIKIENGMPVSIKNKAQKTYKKIK